MGSSVIPSRSSCILSNYLSKSSSYQVVNMANRVISRFGRKSLHSYSVVFQRNSIAQTSSWTATKRILDNELQTIKQAGTWKAERIITTKQDASISVEGRKEPVLNFCANNYLGLSSHPEVVKAGKEALDRYGAGLSSVRFICGTQNLHKNLERKIAKFHGREDTILYASCFDANAGLFEVLLTPEDAVLSDELNHASIIDGIRLCKANKYRYKHRDMADLEEKLKDAQKYRMRLIATDGVFSMDGNVAPLKQICDLAERYQAMVFVDECHATGFFGKTGRGTEEYFGIMGKVDIINSTLGKALGGAAGGYTTAKRELVDLLRQRSRPYLFSNSLPPPVVACADKVFDILLHSSELTEKVNNNTQRFRSMMKSAGFTIAVEWKHVSYELLPKISENFIVPVKPVAVQHSTTRCLEGDEHPICPVMLGDAKLAADFADKMLEKGIYVIGFSYPVVPKGKARIRVQMSAAHSVDDVDRTVAAFIEVGKEMNVI